MSRLRRITNAEAYTVNGVRVWLQISNTREGFAHRLAVNGVAADWHGYMSIALFQHGKHTYGATTEYFTTLPAVFEIIKGVKDV